MAATLRDACLSMNHDVVRSTASAMEDWIEASQAGAMEVGFWQGVLRFCAKQHSDSITSHFLLTKSDSLNPLRCHQAWRESVRH
jgi:hypothetical protein